MDTNGISTTPQNCAWYANFAEEPPCKLRFQAIPSAHQGLSRLSTQTEELDKLRDDICRDTLLNICNLFGVFAVNKRYAHQIFLVHIHDMLVRTDILRMDPQQPHIGPKHRGGTISKLDLLECTQQTNDHIVERELRTAPRLNSLVYQLIPSKNWYFAGRNFICSRYLPLLAKSEINNEVVEASSEMIVPSTLDM